MTYHLDDLVLMRSHYRIEHPAIKTASTFEVIARLLFVALVLQFFAEHASAKLVPFFICAFVLFIIYNFNKII